MVHIEGEDADGDRVTYRYQWVVNDLPVPGAADVQYAVRQLKNGDRVWVELTPNDGKVDGAVFKSEAVVVGNSAPEITEIHLEPVPLHRGDILRARVAANDPDGDPVQLTYKWFRNGREIPGARGDNLDTKFFQKKDMFAVLVIASDGKTSREPIGSTPVVLQNSPPRFTSTPASVVVDGQYFYQVTAVDPDEDPITFELKQAPPGMTIEAATGKLTWKLTPESNGKQRVIILAKDAENAITQQDFEIEGLAGTPAPQ
jgi:hypothetical protein